MNDGPRRVSCRVTADALYHLTAGRYRTAISAFDTVRLHIEIIASAKYDSRIVEEDGTITVRPADLTAAFGCLIQVSDRLRNVITP